MGFNLSSKPYKTWGIAGSQRLIEDESSRGRVNISGYFCRETQEFIYSFIEKGNSQTFIDSLINLMDKNPNVKLTVILDNARLHKSKLVNEFLKTINNLTLLFLPPYSPHLNPIERVWWFFRKKRLANKCFKFNQQIKDIFIDFFLNVSKIELYYATNL